MTKTLTEQWYDGTLQEGFYYYKLDDVIDISKKDAIDVFGIYADDERIKDIEVLAPVPSYEEYLVLSEYKKLEKDAIQNLINEHIADLSKKVERLQEQLNEANEALKSFHYSQEYVVVDFEKIKAYLKKWGVK